MWQGLRGEPLEIEFDAPLTLTCSRFETQVTFTQDVQKLGSAAPGQHLLPIIERVLLESRNLRQAGQEFRSQEQGALSIAATHSQARYALPMAVQEFRGSFPEVQLHLRQGSPRQVAQMLLEARRMSASLPRPLGTIHNWSHSPAFAGLIH